MKFLAILAFLVIFVVATIFSVLNFHPVEIHFFFTSFTLPLTLVLTLELLAGIVIGVLATFIHIIRLKSQYAKLDRKMRSVDNQR